MIIEANGKIHHLEDWDRCRLACPINKTHRARYVLMNIETTPEVVEELETALRFNDAVLRYLTIKIKYTVIEVSPMLGGEKTKNLLNSAVTAGEVAEVE